MNATKVQFSADELALVEDAKWILTKNNIIIKICDLFSEIVKEMEPVIVASKLPQEIRQTSSKISRGENYKGFPYVVLDYPRFFTKDNVFAIRTLFWWAKYFSVTLHLKGTYKKLFLEKIKNNLSVFSQNDFYININVNEWQHDLHESDYMQLKHVTSALLEENFLQHDLLKLTVTVELNQWNQLRNPVLEHFFKIVQVLEN
jgi:hypothetical protein